jgi:3-oxoacyl-[acyl-carrier protein] reductase
MKNKNKTTLILGGSSDIGTETTSKFLSKGWKVIAHYNTNNDSLKKLKKIYVKKLFLIPANFKNKNSINLFLKKIKRFDISSFVNLIGYIDNISYQKTNLISLVNSLQINSLIPMLIQKSLLKNMKEKKFGRMLHVSSIGVKYGGGENTFSYSLSKHLLEFNPSFIKKLSQHNLLSNILRVGFVNTKIHKKIRNKNLSKRIDLIPIKRAAEINEITDMIFFLASEKNSYISNETITIAGGE